MRVKSATGSQKWLLLTLVVVIGVPLATQNFKNSVGAEELQGPTTSERRIARLIANLMPAKHLSGDRLNDEYSGRAFDLFLKTLDPMKLYFLQSDVDEFSSERLNIDNTVTKGDISLAYTIFRRFLQRVDERLTDVEQLLAGEFDFTADEVIITEPKETQYAANAAEAKERWKRQLKYSLLVLEEDGKTREEALEQLDKRYHSNARRWHQTNDDRLLEIYLTSITSSFDPHTTYMSPNTLENFDIAMRLSLEGIGAVLQDKDGQTVVSKVVPGGAAAKHGELKADDHIVSVAQGDDGEFVDIVEMPLDEVVKLIRGNAGTVVRLGVKKGGVGESEVLRIVRSKVELEDSAARGKVIYGEKKTDGTQHKIGYIDLPSFYMDMEGARAGRADFRSSTRDVARILADFRTQGVDGVVLDLSSNGGGSLTEAINLTGLFIDRGPVVQIKDSGGNVEAYSDEDSGVAWDGPLVVMTSKLSASASEILAGAIKDYGRGLIVGDPVTHGKGTVQTLLDLDREVFGGIGQPLGALKVTLQQFYLPDGLSTQRGGVEADVVLPSLTTHLDIAESDLDYALPTDRVPPASHRSYRMVPPDVLGVLRARSNDRVKREQEFVDLMRRIDSYRERKKDTTLPLNREKFIEYRKELNEQQKEMEALVEEKEATDSVFVDSFYNQEVLKITSDYVDLLAQQNLAKAG
jgi:carboxyl-terminal processing protease